MAAPPTGGQEAASPTGEEPIFGQPAPQLELQRESVRIPSGTRLHREPDASSGVLLTFDLEVELPAIERRGAWARVQWEGWTGWVWLAGEDSASALGAADLRRDRPPDPDRLARLRRQFANSGREEHAGAFLVLTDLTPGSRLRSLLAVAAAVPSAYEQAWGIAVPEGISAVVGIFRHEESYQELQEEEAQLSGIASFGHAGGGVAALAVGERQPDEVEALLVHELVHLLNRECLAAALPPWLEEGLAEGMALSPAGGQGQLQLAKLRGRVEVEETRGSAGRRGQRLVRVSGSVATLDRLATRPAESRTPLALLLVASWREFLAPESRARNYATAAFLLRFLTRDPDLGPPSRLFLTGVAAGDPADGEVLLATLGLSIEELESRFASWLLSRRSSYGLP